MLGRSRFWVLALLFYWAYFDLTASAILAPPGMTPVTVRLYNLMHYGRTAVLSAMVMVSFAVPVVLAAAAGLGQGRLLRWVCHV
jgi:ABC-type Fe3+ transport system permease subunit